MITLYFVLLLLACVCFVVSALMPEPRRVHLISLGLALWSAVPFIQTLHKL